MTCVHVYTGSTSNCGELHTVYCYYCTVCVICWGSFAILFSILTWSTCAGSVVSGYRRSSWPVLKLIHLKRESVDSLGCLFELEWFYSSVAIISFSILPSFLPV